MPGMPSIERRPDESEDEFRDRQKRVEIRYYLSNVPSTSDEFATHPLWQDSAFTNGNVTFNSGQFTVFVKHGRFNWVIGGGKPLYGPGGLSTRQAALESLWEYLEEFRAAESGDGEEDLA